MHNNTIIPMTIPAIAPPDKPFLFGVGVGPGVGPGGGGRVV